MQSKQGKVTWSAVRCRHFQNNLASPFRRFLVLDLRMDWASISAISARPSSGVQKKCLRPGPQVADSKRLNQAEELANKQLFWNWRNQWFGWLCARLAPTEAAAVLDEGHPKGDENEK
jgi:hypothetical protein